jgi:hypothetical protein
LGSFLQRLSKDRSRAAPTRQQATDYTLLHLLLSVLPQYQRKPSFAIAAYHYPNPFALLARAKSIWRRFFPQVLSPSGTPPPVAEGPGLDRIRGRQIGSTVRQPSKISKGGVSGEALPQTAKYAARELIAPAVKGNVPVFREFTSAVVPQRTKHSAGGAVPSPRETPVYGFVAINAERIASQALSPGSLSLLWRSAHTAGVRATG